MRLDQAEEMFGEILLRALDAVGPENVDAFMERTGVGRLFMDFALALTGRQAGGPGKVSVVSSSLFGTISGSAVADAAGLGQIQHKAMVDAGYKPTISAAIVASASTIGPVIPPNRHTLLLAGAVMPPPWLK